MKKFKFLLALASAAALMACGPTTNPSNSEQGGAEGWKVDFKCDEHAEVKVYTTQDLTVLDEGPVYYTRVGDTDEYTKEDGQINFVVTPAEGYDVTVTATEGAFKNLKTEYDLLKENTYRITKVTKDMEVTITSTPREEKDGFRVKVFVDSKISLDVYTDKTFATKDTADAKGYYYTRNGDDGTLTKAEGQVNFKATVAEGNSIRVSATEGAYKNIKTSADLLKDEGVENAFRVTKITNDIVIVFAAESSTDAKGFKVGLEKDANVEKVIFYKDQTCEIVDDDAQIQTRNGKAEPYPYCNDSNDAQVSFKVVCKAGYQVASVTVKEGMDAYKNLKEPDETGLENVYRITKVNQDITIVIATEAI